MSIINNVIYSEHLLSFWESGILVYARQRVPVERVSTWLVPVKKILGAESMMNHSGRQDFTWLVTPVARGIKHVLCDTSRRGILEDCSWFPPDFVLSAFLFAYFVCIPLLQQILAQSMTICWVLWVLLMLLNLVIILRTYDTVTNIEIGGDWSHQ